MLCLCVMCVGIFIFYITQCVRYSKSNCNSQILRIRVLLFEVTIDVQHNARQSNFFLRIFINSAFMNTFISADLKRIPANSCAATDLYSKSGCLCLISLHKTHIKIVKNIKTVCQAFQNNLFSRNSNSNLVHFRNTYLNRFFIIYKRSWYLQAIPV